MDVLSRMISRSSNALNNLQLATTLSLAAVLMVTLGANEIDAAEIDAAEVDVAETDVDAQPYIVFVAEPDSFSRCGPGKDHYQTEALRQGQELEVYVETSDGWLGIRPTEKSFCWMPAEVVELSNDGQSGTIREDEAIAWIGTNLGQAKRYRWQVQLEKGESVSIIGKTKRKESDGEKTWLRIAPPSGEFRWVHQDQVVESAVALAKRVAAQVNRSSVSVASADPKSNRELATVALREEVIDNAGPTGLRQATDIPADALRDPEVVDSGLEDTNGDYPSDVASTRRSMESRAGEQTNEQRLHEATVIPDLKPAPLAASANQANSAQHKGSSKGPTHKMADRPFQFHRDAPAEAFRDRGAVIGSGLREEWQEQDQDVSPASFVEEGSKSVLSGDSVVEPAPNGAAAAAEAIAGPLKRMTDVVANFISPPRLVDIGPTTAAPYQSSAIDRRWMVGGTRRDDVTATGLPPQSLTPMRFPAGSGSHLPSAGVPSVAGATVSNQVPNRVVSVAAISRVEDAVKGASVDTLGQVLSKLMAEGASAEEVAPLVRRAEVLLRSGDVNQATRTREVFELAQRYHDVAFRRDGKATIQSTPLTTPMTPLVASTSRLGTPIPAGGTAIAQVGAEQPLGTSGAGQTTTSTMTNSLPAPTTIQTPLGPVAGSASGYLVQVYSSRANSPPYALTDDAGLTVAYVTPYPGVNLRNHLNSRITVSGNEKLLEGMSTPHILVDRAIRR